MPDPPRVLLWTDDPRRKQSWANMLAPRFQVVDPITGSHAAGDPPAPTAESPLLGTGVPGYGEGAGEALLGTGVPSYDFFELLITDRPDWPARFGELRQSGELAVISVGNVPPADVALPDRFTDSELRLACQLLAEIVTLRRQAREAEATHRQLSSLAREDALTGLSNRRAWDERLERRARSDCDGAAALCLAIIDLDHFKQVNDQYGHAMGDELLRVVGRVLRDNLRQGDFAARLGGDEFVLLLMQLDERHAPDVIRRLRETVGAATGGDRLPAITASIGWTLGEDSNELDLKSMLAAADSALRRAKRLGRDQAIFAPTRPPGRLRL